MVEVAQRIQFVGRQAQVAERRFPDKSVCSFTRCAIHVYQPVAVERRSIGDFLTVGCVQRKKQKQKNAVFHICGYLSETTSQIYNFQNNNLSFCYPVNLIYECALLLCIFVNMKFLFTIVR